jgi:hypothetical protein
LSVRGHQEGEREHGEPDYLSHEGRVYQRPGPVGGFPGKQREIAGAAQALECGFEIPKFAGMPAPSTSGYAAIPE